MNFLDYLKYTCEKEMGKSYDGSKWAWEQWFIDITENRLHELSSKWEKILIKQNK